MLIPCHERIRYLREKEHVSFRRISAALGISVWTYRGYESGRSRIPVGLLIRLARYYDCSMNYIFGASRIRGSFPRYM